MKFKKGAIPWNKGKKCTEEMKKKTSESTKLAMRDLCIRYKCGNATRNKKLPEETKKRMSESHKGKVFSETHKKNLSEASMGNSNFLNKHHSEISKRKIGEANRISQRGHKQSYKTRLKRREKMIDYIIKTRGDFKVNIGKNETAILDSIENDQHIKIERGFRVLGYFTDGYCHETNTIYEVYEKYHDRQVQKDLERETEICNHLSCNFIIIWN